MPSFQTFLLQEIPKSDLWSLRALIFPLTLTFLFSVTVSVLLIQIQNKLYFQHGQELPSELDQFYTQLEHLNLSSIASDQEIQALHEDKLHVVQNVTNYRIERILQDLDFIMKKLDRFKKKSFNERIQTLKDDVDQRISQLKATLSVGMSQMNQHLDHQSHLIVQLQEMTRDQNNYNADIHGVLWNTTLIHRSWEAKLENVSGAIQDLQDKVNRQFREPPTELVQVIQKTCHETLEERKQEIMNDLESKMSTLASNLTRDLKNELLARVLKQNNESGVDLELIQSVLTQSLNASDGMDEAIKETLKDLRGQMNATDRIVADLHLEQDHINEELEYLSDQVNDINETLVQPLRGHVKNLKRMEILDEVRLNFFTINGTEYYVVQKKETFSAAKDKCAQLNGQLAEFQSFEEFQKVHQSRLAMHLKGPKQKT